MLSFIFLSSLVACLTIFKSVAPFILRNECMNDGQFISYPGKILQGAILSISQQNEHDCQTECLLNDRCKSFNFDIDGKSECQLNSKIAGDNGTEFVSKIGWTYKSTNFSSTQVNISIQILEKVEYWN